MNIALLKPRDRASTAMTGFAFTRHAFITQSPPCSQSSNFTVEPSASQGGIKFLGDATNVKRLPALLTTEKNRKDNNDDVK